MKTIRKDSDEVDNLGKRIFEANFLAVLPNTNLMKVPEENDYGIDYFAELGKRLEHDSALMGDFIVIQLKSKRNFSTNVDGSIRLSFSVYDWKYLLKIEKKIRPTAISMTVLETEKSYIKFLQEITNSEKIDLNKDSELFLKSWLKVSFLTGCPDLNGGDSGLKKSKYPCKPC